jgi:class 3 adenylate cyclase/tetratricopeptide (TPR) repeat protein
VTCPVCGTVPVPGARFCHHCGSALPAAATLPAAERRVVTVLFGDLSDFTAWAEDLDPERVGAVTDRVLAALAGAVKTFGGHVDKLTGDGIMAVFGAPVAHEDDAERAVRAALSMQRAVRRVLDEERGGGAPLGLRAGLNTGAVVAGVQAALEYTVIGDTVNTAARLADAAAIAAVYAGPATAAATRHIASWRALRPLRLKGKRQAVEAYELLGLLDAPGTRSGLGDEAPFVGREVELGRVAGRLTEVVDRGEPRVLVMTAEAGLGKTRFAAEVERFAAGYSAAGAGYVPGAGARVLSVHCAAFGERRRLAPLADLVRLAIGLPKDASSTREQAEGRLRRLAERTARAARVRAAGTPAAVAVPPPRFATDVLLKLLGYGEPVSGPTADRAVWTVPSGPRTGHDDDLDLETIPTAVAELLSALATEEPLVVIVDDLHDATPETAHALGATLSRLTGPVLVLLLGRPELVRTAGMLTRLADAEVTALTPLRGADAARLLTAYLGGGRLAQPDEDRLLATAQGNPFYLAELVALLQERGALTSTGADQHAAWRLAPGSLAGRLLSRDLAAVLAARIDALPADSRAALRDASVIGDTVPAGALEELRQGRFGQVARPAAVAAVELERAVDELLQRRMLRRVRGGYAFATPLLREAAYAGIGKADLAERHALLVRWAAPGPEDSGRPTGRSRPGRLGMTAESADAFLAEHAERAAALADAVGLRAEAAARQVVPLGVAALGRLARHALATGEPEQAARYCDRATTLAGGALPPADRLVHARALLQLGRAAAALAYAEKISANADDGGVRAGALLLAGRAYRLLGDPDRAYTTWLDALDAATVADRPGERAEAMRRLGMGDYLAGRLAEAGTRFTAAYQVALSAGDRRSQAWSLQNLAWVTTTRGDFAGADAALARAARSFAELADPVGRAWLRGTTAFVRMLAGRLTEARRLAQVFLPFGERVGEAWAVGTLRAVEAYAAAELGELTEADREARRAYREFAAADDDWGRGLALVVRGVVARGLGEATHAIDLLTDALAYGEKTHHPLLIGMARTIRGFVRCEQGDAGGAEADARAVLAVVEPHDVLESAQVGPRVLLGLARQSAGDLPAAIHLLAPVAEAVQAPALLFPRRQAVACYAGALLEAGHTAEALGWARRAAAVSSEDVRSRVYAGRVLARALARAGDAGEAAAVAAEAVREAYATQQASERDAADRVRLQVEAAAVAP